MTLIPAKTPLYAPNNLSRYYLSYDKSLLVHKYMTVRLTSLQCYMLVKIPFCSEMCLWAWLCKMMYVQSLTLEGCFHTHLLKREGFSVLAFNLSLRRVLTSVHLHFMTSQLVWKAIRVQYATCTSVMCKLGASIVHWEWTFLWSRTSCVQQLNVWNEKYLRCHSFWIFLLGRKQCHFKFFFFFF